MRGRHGQTAIHSDHAGGGRTKYTKGTSEGVIKVNRAELPYQHTTSRNLTFVQAALEEICSFNCQMSLVAQMIEQIRDVFDDSIKKLKV